MKPSAAQPAVQWNDSTGLLLDPASGSSTVNAVLDFDTLYKDEIGFVWRCLRALGVESAALADAAQEVFVIVHRRFEAALQNGPLRPWLYGVVRNVALNQRRGQRRRNTRFSPLEDEPIAPQPTPLQNALVRETAHFVALFLEELDERKREVFILAEIEEWTIPEVAAALGIPLNTAYTRLRAARLQFENHVAAQEHRP